MHIPPSTSSNRPAGPTPGDSSGPSDTHTPPNLAGVRIALAHDWLVGYRGGEAVLDRIARVLTAAGATIGALYTLVDDHRPLTPTIDAIPKKTSWLAGWPGAASSARRWLLPLYPAAVRDLSRALARHHAVEQFDLLVSTSSAAIKNIAPPPGVPHVCYCHHPPRYIWSQSDQYPGLAKQLGLALTKRRLQRWDGRCDHVSQFLANSTHTRDEIVRRYRRDAVVVHPPVRTDFFTPPSGPHREPEDAQGPAERPLLVAGALEPYKRIDLAIDAAHLLGEPLIVAGTGSIERALRKRAPANVRCVGRVSDDELRELYRRARCLLFPQVEDFGITAVEALACGTPIVARRAGGALDTVSLQTGRFFDDASPEGLAQAIEQAPPKTAATMAACRAAAEHFAPKHFDAGFLRVIDQTLNKAAK